MKHMRAPMPISIAFRVLAAAVSGTLFAEARGVGRLQRLRTPLGAADSGGEAADVGCTAAMYSLRLDGQQGTFGLPPGGVGKLEGRPCVFEDVAYSEGMVEFECKTGGWQNTGITCKQPSPVEGQCQYTTYTFKMNERDGKFLLPLGNDGAVYTASCAFDGVTYSKGTMEFTCVDKEWNCTTHSCAQPTDGSCPPILHTFTLNGQPGEFELPEGKDRDVLERPCVFEEETYGSGSVNFECHAGAWIFADYTCSEPESGFCLATDFTFEFNGRAGVFKLPQADNGAVEEKPCKFRSEAGTETSMSGSLKFACKNSKWENIAYSCDDGF